MTAAIRHLVRVLFLLAGLGSACALDYPAKPIRLIVGFTPGGTVDATARLVGNDLQKEWGQPVVVENRPGANGSTATAALAKSPPDGYTLMLTVSSHVTNGLLYKGVSYDIDKDFAPISLLAAAPLLVLANARFPASNAAELIELAKRRPNTISSGSPGVGSTQHLTMELLCSMAGIKLIHVPYRGGDTALTDTVSGQIQLTVNSSSGRPIPLIQSGDLKALAVTSLTRAKVLPDVPTLAEQGLGGFESELWFGLIAPAGTPPAIVAKLSEQTTRFVKSAQMRAGLEADGARAIGSTPDEFAAYLKSETEKWGRIIREAGIKME